MADGVFNIAKGRAIELHNRVANNDPAASGLVVVLLKAAEADATLEDYDNLSLLLAAAGNTEADFTNYARKVLTDTDISAATPDDTNNRQEADIPDQTWTSAGGTTDNTLAKLIICYDSDTGAGDDTGLVPLSHHDFVATTDGNDLTATIDANGYFRSS